MQKSLTKFTMVLAAVLALSMVASAQTDEGQAGQQPAGNQARGRGRGRGEASAPSPTANLPYDPHDFSEYGWGAAERLTR
jgi:hypothetical protein